MASSELLQSASGRPKSLKRVVEDFLEDDQSSPNKAIHSSSGNT